MTDADKPGLAIDLGATDFDAVYRGDGLADIPFDKPPWDIEGPQPYVVGLEREGEFRGRVLDIGSGAGENAIFLAGQGYTVTGVDGSPSAVEIARGRAGERGVEVDFQVADATKLEGLPQEFDTVLDSALYHCLPGEARDAYVTALHGVAKPGARLHLLCFADVEDTFMPGVVGQDELRARFGAHWRVEGIELIRYSGAFDRETVARFFGELTGGVDLDKVVTDAEGRVTIPMWHLRAERI